MICPAETLDAFRAGVAAGFALGAVFALLLVAIHKTGRQDK